MSHVAYRTRPELSRPVMICAFSGWNDGGEAAAFPLIALEDVAQANVFVRAWDSVRLWFK